MRSLVAVAIFSSLVACRRAEPLPTAAPSASGSAAAPPSLAVDHDEHHFGDVVQGASAEHVFRITNHGGAELVVSDLSSPCACIEVSLAERKLSPGASAEIKARYRAIGTTGPDQRRIRVASNDPIAPERWLTLAANVQPNIRFEPAALVLGSEKSATSTLVGTVVERSRLGVASVQGEPSAVAAVRVRVSEPPYDRQRRPTVTVERTQVKSERGVVVALINTGLPDPVQLPVRIEWDDSPKR